MFHLDDILFGVSLALGSCLVLGSALGVNDLFGDAELDASADADVAGESPAESGGDSTFSVLGLGRVPLVILLMLLSLLFGSTGLLLSPLFHALFGGSFGAFASLVVAGCVALLGTRFLSRVLARLLPSSESYASQKVDLVGCEGTVIVASRRGDAVLRVVDQGGAELRVRCDTGGRDLSVGDRVHMLAYDQERDRFDVEKVSVS